PFPVLHTLLKNFVLLPELFCLFFTFNKVQIRGYFIVHDMLPPYYIGNSEKVKVNAIYNTFNNYSLPYSLLSISERREFKKSCLLFSKTLMNSPFFVAFFNEIIYTVQ